MTATAGQVGCMLCVELIGIGNRLHELALRYDNSPTLLKIEDDLMMLRTAAAIDLHRIAHFEELAAQRGDSS